jgi:pimeloyl-ACP methyl ester carboxylesterase
MNNPLVLVATVAAALAALATPAAAQTKACAAQPSSEGKSIEEARFVPLGGIDQWVTIRGTNRTNPILLHVHGGPGIAFSAFVAEFAPYEADFTVVQWDQRGSGCTFGRNGETTPDVTLNRLARDGIELAGYLHDRFADRKIIVLGHSFGTIVATEMVRRAPEQFAAYVGTGQFTSLAATMEALLTHLRAVAAAAGDADLAAQLDQVAALDGPSQQKFGALNRLMSSRMPAVDAAFMRRLEPRAAEVMTAKELADWQNGRRTSMGRLMPEMPQVDLVVGVGRLEVPFILIQGSDDTNTPTAPAVVYFEGVEAPAKELVVIDGAGHFPHLTHAPQFLAALLHTARPRASN